MKVAVCSAQSYDRQFLLAANRDIGHELIFFDSHLCEETRQIVAGFPAVCVFVNDTLNAAVLQTLAAQGTRLIALRCAGFNNVDIQAANSLCLHVVRVPAYSPHSVAEHSAALNITQLLEHMALRGKRIAVERNGEIVPRSKFDEQLLINGDRLEIVVAVGGG